jgi:hypothetical protein
VYFNFVDWMPAMRYHAALVPLLLVPLASLQCVIPKDRWTLSTRAAQTRGSIALVIVVLLSGLGLNHLKIASAAMSESMREALAPLGDWLRSTVSPSAWLAMSDVGAVPYISGLRTIDIHTESLTDLHIARGEFTAEYVLRKEPTVVALAVRGLQSARMDPLHYSLYKSEEFNANYQFIGTVRHRWYQERAYWVFIRGGSRVDTDQLDRLPIGVGNLHISTYQRLGSNPR